MKLFDSLCKKWYAQYMCIFMNSLIIHWARRQHTTTRRFQLIKGCWSLIMRMKRTNPHCK